MIINCINNAATDAHPCDYYFLLINYTYKAAYDNLTLI